MMILRMLTLLQLSGVASDQGLVVAIDDLLRCQVATRVYL